MKYLSGYRLYPIMKSNFKFQIGNRGLLAQELGLVDRLNASFRASALKHGVALNPGSSVTIKVLNSNGRVVRRVSAEDKDPVEVPLATA